MNSKINQNDCKIMNYLFDAYTLQGYDGRTEAIAPRVTNKQNENTFRSNRISTC
jgi:hypothetical protein